MRAIVVGLAALSCVVMACSGSGPGNTGGNGGSGAGGGGGAGGGDTGGSGQVSNCPGPASATPSFWLSKADNPIVDVTLTNAKVTSNRARISSDLNHGDYLLSVQSAQDSSSRQFFYTVPPQYRVPDTVMLGDTVTLHFHRDRPGATNLDEYADVRTSDGHLIWAAAALHAGNTAPAGFPDLVVSPPAANAAPLCLDVAPPCGARARYAPLADMALGALPVTPGMEANLVGPRDSGTLFVTEFMSQTDATGCAEAAPAVGWVFLGTRNGDEEATPPCGGTTQCTSGEYCDDPKNACSPEEMDGVCRRYFDSDPTSPQACGCDGTVYDNARLAAKAGLDVHDATKCTAPGGTFACGGFFCPLANKVCVGAPNYCDPPNGCEGKTPACDCLMAAQDAGCTCSGDAGTGITITCK